MKSTTATVRIRLDQAVEVENRLMNLSEFVREKLDEEFGSNDFIAAKEKELSEKLKKLKQIRKDSKVQSKDKQADEEKFLKGAKKRIQDDPGEATENCRVYNQKFSKRFTVQKFRELIGE